MSKIIHKKLKKITHLLWFFKKYFPYLLNFKKIYNCLKVEREYKEKKSFLESRPYYFYVDIGNICNLRCPLCPTGTQSDKRKRGFMNYKTYRTILDKIKPYAIEVMLFNWGEPFLNKDLFKIIKYTKTNGLYATLSSNFNTPTEEMIANIVKSRVDQIIISLDGASQKSYSAYRRGGDFNKVITNLKKLVNYKKRYKSKTPKIIWKFLTNKKNIKELKIAKKMAGELGVNFRWGRMTLNQQIIRKGEIIDKNLIEEWIPKKLRDRESNYRFAAPPPCRFLYDTMVINPEGTISPCCAIFDAKTDFGDILKSSLEKLWNNKKFVSSRKIFQKNSNNQVKTICHDCSSIIEK